MGAPTNPVSTDVRSLLITTRFSGSLKPDVACRLLAHVLGVPAISLMRHQDRPVTEAQAQQYQALISRAAAGEPAPYLVGQVRFGGLPFEVTPNVLIPRRVTQTLVQTVLKWAAQRAGRLRIVDVGTGCGAIGVSLADRLPRAHVWAVDISADALKVAQRNAALNGVEGRMTFQPMDLLSDLPGPFDVICGNLPYIRPERLPLIQWARYEPHIAFTDGIRGTSIVRRMVRQAADGRLAPDGLLALEINGSQKAAIRAAFRRCFPQAVITVHKDFVGTDRVVTAELG